MHIVKDNILLPKTSKYAVLEASSKLVGISYAKLFNSLIPKRSFFS